jgi:hypothetical protein
VNLICKVNCTAMKAEGMMSLKEGLSHLAIFVDMILILRVKKAIGTKCEWCLKQVCVRGINLRSKSTVGELLTVHRIV